MVQIRPTGKTYTLTGTHDLHGSFTIDTRGQDILPCPLKGNYDEYSITGSVTCEEVYSLSFTLQAANQPPKITLEPATYPEFQMNILKGEGFTVKIRKEDGIWDSNGKSKLNFSTLVFATDSMDNSANFINTGANQNIFSVSSDQKEILLKVTPDPQKFMSYQNVFGIPKNGEHKIGFQICDTDGRCGKSEYTVYFGPFFTAKSVTDLRCNIYGYREEVLLIEDEVTGNTGYASYQTKEYRALINAKNPDEYWCAAYVPYDQDLDILIWFEGRVVPFLSHTFMSEGYLSIVPFARISLEVGLSGANTLQSFPAGEYYFFSFAADHSSGAIKGDFKNITTCN